MNNHTLMTTMLSIIRLFIDAFFPVPVRRPMTDIEHAHADLMFRRKKTIKPFVTKGVSTRK